MAGASDGRDTAASDDNHRPATGADRPSDDRPVTWRGRAWKLFRDHALITTLMTIIGTASGIIFADRSADHEEKKQLADRLDVVHAQLKSPDPQDQIFGIRELKRVAADSSADELRDDAIEWITDYLRTKTSGIAAKDCVGSSLTRIAEEVVEAVGHLNQEGMAEIDLSHTCLAGIEIDASEVNLSNVNFSHANLSGARFVGIDLVNARFDWATLTNTEFSAVDLSGAVLCYTDTTEADIRSGQFVRTALNERSTAELKEKPIDVSRVDRC